MKNMPVPMTKEQLLEHLHVIIAHIEADDSFEGNLQYLMPYPEQCWECHGDGRIPPCVTCGGKGEIEYPENINFLVSAAYRVGNLQGQGGMRMIGELR